jgi:hypothetical protein
MKRPKITLELTGMELTLLIRAMQGTRDTKANNALFGRLEKLNDERWEAQRLADIKETERTAR